MATYYLQDGDRENKDLWGDGLSPNRPLHISSLSTSGMFVKGDKYEDVYNSKSETEHSGNEWIMVHYDRKCEVAKKPRKDGRICFMFGDKMKCFHPEQVKIDEENKIITISAEDAIKRGFA